MKLIFLSSDNIGDAILANEVLHQLVKSIPKIGISVYIKNTAKTSSIYAANSNIETITSVSTQFYRKKFFHDVLHINRKINVTPKNEPIYITSLLGSPTLLLALFPVLLIHKMCGREIKMFGMKAYLPSADEHLTLNRVKHLEENIGVKIRRTQTTFLQDFIGSANIPSHMQNPQKIMAITAGASTIKKTLPPEKFVKIIEHFFAKGWKIQLLGSDSKVDTKQANEIMRLLPPEIQVENRLGKTTPKEYFLNIAQANYVLTNDSSAQHIAHYLNVPCTVLWARDRNSPIVKAYAWQNPKILNFFNQIYISCKKCEMREKLLKRKPHCNNCIAKNYSIIDAQEVIKQMDERISKLEF